MFKFWCSLMLVTLSHASVINIGNNVKINFDDKKWNYLFFKPTQEISSHHFTHKKLKQKFYLIKENHLAFNRKKVSVIDECEKTNRYFLESKTGKAEILQLKKGQACLVTTTHSHQLLFPLPSKEVSYEVLSFSWQGLDPLFQKEVVDFIEGAF